MVSKLLNRKIIPPLHSAIWFNRSEIIKHLVCYGATIIESNIIDMCRYSNIEPLQLLIDIFPYTFKHDNLNNKFIIKKIVDNYKNKGFFPIYN